MSRADYGSLFSAVEACRGGDSVEERVAGFAERAGSDPFNAYVTLAPERAIARARGLDRSPRTGKLFGLVVSVKDNIAVRDVRMTCGSRILQDYVAPYDATVVQRLEAEGAVILGKTNLDEFACGSSGERSAFGPTRNPRDPERVPGGSSSGAGASVAAGYCDIAVGSDTGGSVRCPASFCGVTAFKPSYGLVSRHGLADMAMSLEGPAPLSASVEGCALFLDAVCGTDPRDPATTATPGRRFRDALSEPLPRLRFGVAREMFDSLAPEVERRTRDAAARLAEGALSEVSMPALEHSLAAYYLITYSEFASAMQRFDGYRYGLRAPDEGLSETTMQNRAALGAEVKRRILLGTYVTMKEYRGKWYSSALAARDAIREGFERAFRQVDLLLAPTMPFPAFKLAERISDPLAMYAADVLTVSANLAGVPAGSVPIPGPGLPVGLQIIGPRGEDARVLRTMAAWEEMAG